MAVPLALYCKSYRTDLKRVERLANSVARFNADQLPFFISVPRNDLTLFESQLSGMGATFLPDESIIAANPQIDFVEFGRLPGYISQQIVKSEFWRLGHAESYLCLDSDAFFIRTFFRNDYLAPDGVPYTVLDENREVLEHALGLGKQHVLNDFLRESRTIQSLFGREGRRYAFGPFPLAWHRSVWESLHQRFLEPKGINLLDAIVQFPMESRWYGEALLAYRAIPLYPCQSFFKVYHYAWQHDQDARKGVSNEMLSKLYSGVIYQSAWEREMDWPNEGGSLLSRFGRRLRRRLGRI